MHSTRPRGAAPAKSGVKNPALDFSKAFRGTFNLIIDSGNSLKTEKIRVFEGETQLEAIKCELGSRVKTEKNSLGEWIVEIDGVRQNRTDGWQVYVNGGLPHFLNPNGAVFLGPDKLEMDEFVDVTLRFDRNVTGDITEVNGRSVLNRCTLSCPNSASVFEGVRKISEALAYTEELQAAQSRMLQQVFHPTIMQARNPLAQARGNALEVQSGKGILVVMELAMKNASSTPLGKTAAFALPAMENMCVYHKPSKKGWKEAGDGEPEPPRPFSSEKKEHGGIHAFASTPETIPAQSVSKKAKPARLDAGKAYAPSESKMRAEETRASANPVPQAFQRKAPLKEEALKGRQEKAPAAREKAKAIEAVAGVKAFEASGIRMTEAEAAREAKAVEASGLKQEEALAVNEEIALSTPVEPIRVDALAIQETPLQQASAPKRIAQVKAVKTEKLVARKERIAVKRVEKKFEEKKKAEKRKARRLKKAARRLWKKVFAKGRKGKCKAKQMRSLILQLRAFGGKRKCAARKGK